MNEKRRIENWQKDGTITKSQAQKMLKDLDSEQNYFLSIVAIIGAVLIFVGCAWLVAKNWHQISNPIKILILAGSTLASFIAGNVTRKNNDGVGRALYVLGAGLYTLSLFLISQIYNLATTQQHNAWILLMSWSVIALTSYFLNSKENLVVSMLVFFPWVFTQYFASNPSNDSQIMMSIILILLGTGALLYGLSVFHRTINHKFRKVYEFWTAFYFLTIFYVLCFQLFLPMISEYSLNIDSFFISFFLLISFCGFLIGTVYSMTRNPNFLKEAGAFLFILLILLGLVLATKVGAGIVGRCNVQNCYQFDDPGQCESAPNDLYCTWKDNHCQKVPCWSYNSQVNCTKVNGACTWAAGRCLDNYEPLYQECEKYDKDSITCKSVDYCKWYPGQSRDDNLPLSLYLLWILNNILFIGFILFMIWVGQRIGSPKVVNLALVFFILEIISRYIGFWMDLDGYLAFSLLAIGGGFLLIAGAYFIPKWRKDLLKEVKK